MGTRGPLQTAPVVCGLRFPDRTDRVASGRATSPAGAPGTHPSEMLGRKPGAGLRPQHLQMLLGGGRGAEAVGSPRLSRLRPRLSAAEFTRTATSIACHCPVGPHTGCADSVRGPRARQHRGRHPLSCSRHVPVTQTFGTGCHPPFGSFSLRRWMDLSFSVFAVDSGQSWPRQTACVRFTAGPGAGGALTGRGQASLCLVSDRRAPSRGCRGPSPSACRCPRKSGEWPIPCLGNACGRTVTFPLSGSPVWRLRESLRTLVFPVDLGPVLGRCGFSTHTCLCPTFNWSQRRVSCSRDP